MGKHLLGLKSLKPSNAYITFQSQIARDVAFKAFGTNETRANRKLRLLNYLDLIKFREVENPETIKWENISNPKLKVKTAILLIILWIIGC